MKTILVTGANRGIGKAIVKAILEQHREARVIVGARQEARGHETVRELTAETPDFHDRLNVVPLDVTSRSSIDAAHQIVRQDFLPEGRLFGLVNNAGIGYPDSELKAVVDVNVYGMHDMVSTFADLMEPVRSRIVNITSAAGPNFVSKCSTEYQSILTDPGLLWADLDQLIRKAIESKSRENMMNIGLGDGSSYGFSKACANALTLIQAREHAPLKINACTPGFIETDLTRPMAEARGMSPEEMGMKSVEHGTIAPLKLLDEALETSGWYYGSDALRSPLHEYRAPGAPEYRP